MPMIFGRLIGAAVGILAGPFGIVFGFLVGYLFDQLMRERRNRKRHRQFFRNPLRALPPGIDRPSLALVGVTVSLCAARGTIVVRQVNTLRSFLSHRVSLVGLPRRQRAVVNRAIDHAVRMGRGMNLPELALCLRAYLTDDSGDRRPLPGTYGRQEVGAFLWSVIGAGVGAPDELYLLVCDLIGVDPPAGRQVPVTDEPDSSSYREACTVLGIQADASQDEVKYVFRTLAAQFHPDTLDGLDERQREASAAAFIRIRSAYDTVLKFRESNRPTSPPV